MTTSSKTSIQHDSVWAATVEMPQFSPLRETLSCDVCVIGAGIAGLTTAYILAKARKSVVVLDDGGIASGMTRFTTAHLSNAIDDRYVEVERLHGEEGARLAAESHTAAIQRIEMIARRERINCDFDRVDGYLFLTPNEPNDLLEREADAARRAGVLGVELLERAPLDGFDTGPCLLFPRQGQFHPLKYLAGLARAIERAGGRIFTETHADGVEGGSRPRVTAGSFAIDAGAVVVATNTPVIDRFAIHTKQAPYMTYVIGARVPHGTVAKALYWDTGDPYHYVRVHSPKSTRRGKRTPNGHDVLIVGGEDHKTGQANDGDDRFARLEAWARERFPTMEDLEFEWSGQVMETIDYLAFIGRNPGDENLYIATGDSGMGMTHGTIAGILLSDQIRGRVNAWDTLYDPSRRTLRAAGAFTRENLNVAAQYADWATSGDVESVDAIAPDSGAVLRRGLQKVAVYRDEAGVLHERSAVCVHLGCVVAWNQSEKTWDCPCHGSRYDRFGTVISGPANSDLSPVEADE